MNQSPVYIPPTPRYGIQKQDLMTSAKDRFAGVSWVELMQDQKPEDLLQDYDNYEVYEETKIYSKRPYLANFKNKLQNYQNYLIIMQTELGDQYYVASKRIPSEMDSLAEFCPCFNCSSFVLNPFKYIWCSHCVKCIKSGSSEYISSAKNLKLKFEQLKKNPIKRNYLIEKWLEFPFAKRIEYGVIIVFAVFILQWIY